MDATLITLIINIVLAAVILFGFLGGLRGLKKSTFDLVVFIVQLLVVFFLTPVISNLVLNITIDGKTINNHILGFVNNLLGAETASSSFIKDIVSNVPIMVVNIAVTILLIVLSCILFKIIAVIVYKIMFKKDKEKVIEKCEIVNGAPQMVKTTVKKKKHRINGAFTGTPHGRGIPIQFAVHIAEFGCGTAAGDGGSRTRVRKPIHATFSGCRPSFVFPACIPGGQGMQVGSPFVRDGCKSELTVHGRHSFYAVVKSGRTPIRDTSGPWHSPNGQPHLGSDC